MPKIGRNRPCPCGSGKKYKDCCLGKVPWPELIANNDPRGVLHMEARGKNIAFLHTIAAILQFDKLPRNYQWRDVKRAVTPNAVRALHEAVVRLWPTERDLRRVLHAQRDQHSALYIGTYNPESLIRGVKRHNLYSDTILIVDPFQHPNTIRPEFNPIENPDLNIASTLAAIRIWWELAPWIEQGIVRIIRTPGDYDPALNMNSIESSRKRAERPELRDLAKKESENWREHMPDFEEYHRLWEPDSWLEQKYREKNPNASSEEVQRFLRMIDDRRLDHPFFPESVYRVRGKQFLIITGGTNFDMALLVAEETGSHLITDLSYRWKEIEVDRESVGARNRAWSSFAKAFDGLTLRFLDNVDMQAAVRLREEGRLEGMRSFFRRIWSKVDEDADFSETNVDDLSAELLEKVAEAEQEWKNIDIELMKWAGPETAALVAGGSAIGAGKGALLAACVVGASNVVMSTMKRRSFPAKYPASFFLGK